MPSKANGLVTTATVSAPISLASEALVGVFESAAPPDFGIGARSEAVGELGAQLYLHRSARELESLKVGIGDHELYAFHAGGDHAVDGIAASATHADNLDLGVIAGIFVEVDANFFLGPLRFLFFVAHVNTSNLF